METRIIKLSEIKPTGNLAEILQKLEEAVKVQETKGYTKKVGDLIKLIVEFGFVDFDWFEDCTIDGEFFEAVPREEAERIVLLGYCFVARLNKIAQKHLNNIDTGSVAKNLMENKELMKHFPNTKFED